MRKNRKKDTYMYIRLDHFPVCQKWTQCCKSTVFQLKKKSRGQSHVGKFEEKKKACANLEASRGSPRLHFHSCQHLCSPHSWPLATTHLFSNFIVWRMLYKWNHTACNRVRLTFFISHNGPEIHPRSWLYQQFIPYCWMTFCCMDALQFVFAIMNIYVQFLCEHTFSFL